MGGMRAVLSPLSVPVSCCSGWLSGADWAPCLAWGLWWSPWAPCPACPAHTALGLAGTGTACVVLTLCRGSSQLLQLCPSSLLWAVTECCHKKLWLFLLGRWWAPETSPCCGWWLVRASCSPDAHHYQSIKTVLLDLVLWFKLTSWYSRHMYKPKLVTHFHVYLQNAVSKATQ